MAGRDPLGGGQRRVGLRDDPGRETWEFELAGMLRDEELEVFAESDTGAIGQPWRPTECRELSVTVTISGGEPEIEEECRREG